MQFQSDILDRKIIKPTNHESTALGAAFLAGLTVGLWNDSKELIASREIDRIYTPDMTREERSALMAGWHKAIGRSKGWAK